MKLRNLILPLMVALLACTTVKAQDREVGIFLGGAFYQGDLSLRQVTLPETRTAAAIMMRYYFNPRWNFRGNLGWGWVEGDDANYGDYNDLNDPNRYRARRNLSFSSNIFELSGLVEFNILPYISNSRRYRFTPYIFGGAALYHFNPKTRNADGDKVALQSLGTEGQNMPGSDIKPYNRLQGAIPYGGGIKYSLGNFWNLDLHFGQRKLFTDYLDDVSGNYPDLNAMRAAGQTQGADLSWRGDELPDCKYCETQPDPTVARGDESDFDMYIFAGFTISKTFRRFPCTDF